jgi:hypothetical protein
MYKNNIYLTINKFFTYNLYDYGTFIIVKRKINIK